MHERQGERYSVALYLHRSPKTINFAHRSVCFQSSNLSQSHMAKKRKLQDLEYEVLISEVQNRTCLWNDRHEDFKNTVITKKLWEEVGKAINMTGDECKKKWKNLKDTFRKKLQTPPAKSGSAGFCSPHKKWKFEKLMEFTRDVLLSSPMVGNLKPPSTEVEEQHTMSPSTEIVEHTMSNSTEVEWATTSCSEDDDRFSRPHRSVRSLRKKEDLEKRMIELEEAKINATLNMVEKTVNKGDDHHFFLSLLPYISRLDDIEKLQLRVKIQNCVLEAVQDHETKTAIRPDIPDPVYDSSSNCRASFDLPSIAEKK